MQEGGGEGGGQIICSAFCSSFHMVAVWGTFSVTMSRQRKNGVAILASNKKLCLANDFEGFPSKIFRHSTILFFSRQ